VVEGNGIGYGFVGTDSMEESCVGISSVLHGTYFNYIQTF